MNPSEELKTIKEEIDKLHVEGKESILGRGEYNGVSKEDRKGMLVVLNSQLTDLKLKYEVEKFNNEIRQIDCKIKKVTLGAGEYKRR